MSAALHHHDAHTELIELVQILSDLLGETTPIAIVVTITDDQTPRIDRIVDADGTWWHDLTPDPLVELAELTLADATALTPITQLAKQTTLDKRSARHLVSLPH